VADPKNKSKKTRRDALRTELRTRALKNLKPLPLLDETLCTVVPSSTYHQLLHCSKQVKRSMAGTARAVITAAESFARVGLSPLGVHEELRQFLNASEREDAFRSLSNEALLALELNACIASMSDNGDGSDTVRRLNIPLAVDTNIFVKTLTNRHRTSPSQVVVALLDLVLF
jgi:hypothetical protein